MRAALLALLLAVSSPNGLVLRDMPEGWARADGVLDVTAACSQRWVGAPVPRSTAWDAFQGGGLPAPTVWTYTYSMKSSAAAREYVRRVKGLVGCTWTTPSQERRWTAAELVGPKVSVPSAAVRFTSPDTLAPVDLVAMAHGSRVGVVAAALVRPDELRRLARLVARRL